MPSKEYLEAVFDMAKEYLPDKLWNKIHKLAFHSAGGRSSSRSSKDNISKLTLVEMQPDILENAPDEEVLQAWHRLNQWYDRAKEEGNAVEDFVNAAVYVIDEMEGRDFNINESSDLFQAATEFESINKSKFNLEERFDKLPEEVVAVHNFVNVVGSAARKDKDANDLDILFRSNFKDKNFLVQSENIELPVRKFLDPKKKGYLHYIFNPQGAHDDFIPMYDLVLRKKNKFKKRVIKEASSLPNWRKYLQKAPRGKFIDLGCGRNKAEGFIGIDKDNYAGVDIVANLENGIPLKDNEASVIRASHVLEHISDSEMIMNEIHRVLKPCGIAIITVPSTQGEGAFAHPSHKSFWNRSSFAFWTIPEYADDRSLFKAEYIQQRGGGDKIYIDAVLRKTKQPINKLDPLSDFDPPKPELRGLTEAFDANKLIGWAKNRDALNEEIGIYIEPKYNGFRCLAMQEGNNFELWFEGQLGENQFDKVPDVEDSLSRVNEDFIIDCDIGIEVEGNRVARPDLMKLNRDEPDWEENEVPILTIFDLPYLNEDLSDLPFEKRRESLKKFYEDNFANVNNIRLSPAEYATDEKEVNEAVEVAFKFDRSEGCIAKTADGVYETDGATNEWFKLKRTIELKVKVLDIQENENNTFSYRGGLRIGDIETYTNKVEFESEEYINLGQTFNTQIKADEGDIITVQILELIPDEEENNLSWLGATVLDIADREEAYFVNQALDIAKRGGVLQKNIKKYVPSYGNLDSKVAFVGASPSDIDKIRNEPLTGLAGRIFKDNYLKPLGFKKEDSFITNLVPICLTDYKNNLREPIQSEINKWSRWLDNQLRKVNPDIVIALGQSANKALGDRADFVLPHPVALMKFGDSGEVNRKISQIKDELIKQGEEGGGDPETRNEASKEFWQNNWQNIFPEDGTGDFVFQHHWRGLTEEQANEMDDDELMENTDHSIHSDLRFEDGEDRLWGFSAYIGDAEDIRKLPDNSKIFNLGDEVDNIRGGFKLAQPKEWLDIASDKPFISPPHEVGSTSKSWSKFFELDSGEYEIGVWHKHYFEFFLDGDKLKGRYQIMSVPVEEGDRIWLLDKPDDKTPYAEDNTKEDIIAERKDEGDKWLVWNNPNDDNPPEKINLEEVEVESKKVKKDIECEIIKQDEERQIVYGVVLEPEVVDAHNDVIDIKEIEKTAHFFMLESQTIGDSHEQKADANVVESYIAPVDFEMGSDRVKKGSWVMGVKIHSKGMWEKVKNGQYTGFSIGGYGVREEV